MYDEKLTVSKAHTNGSRCRPKISEKLLYAELELERVYLLRAEVSEGGLDIGLVGEVELELRLAGLLRQSQDNLIFSLCNKAKKKKRERLFSNRSHKAAD